MQHCAASRTGEAYRKLPYPLLAPSTSPSPLPSPFPPSIPLPPPLLPPLPLPLNPNATPIPLPLSPSLEANTPTDFCFSFRGFRERGGRTGRHVDGWGVAFFEGKGFRNFCDSLPSALSPVANLICTYPIKTRTVIAHVRMATQGKVRLENVHPFSRELWGRCVLACFLVVWFYGVRVAISAQPFPRRGLPVWWGMFPFAHQM